MKDTLSPPATGISLSRLIGFDADGLPLVALADGDCAPARSLVPLGDTPAGTELAITALDGAPGTMLILGCLDAPRPDRAVFEAGRELVLRCGNASVTLGADGKLTLRGTQVLSRASGANRVQGASVQLN